MLIKTLKAAKSIVIITVGFTVLILGLILLVLPGPGLLVIFFGLVILAGECIWARRFLKKVKSHMKRINMKI